MGFVDTLKIIFKKINCHVSINLSRVLLSILTTVVILNFENNLGRIKVI